MAERKTIDGSLALVDKQVRVITIEATEKPHAARLRVAAYARVSSSSADLSAPVIKCKKPPRKKCSFVAEEAKKR